MFTCLRQRPGNPPPLFAPSITTMEELLLRSPAEDEGGMETHVANVHAGRIQSPHLPPAFTVSPSRLRITPSRIGASWDPRNSRLADP